jgi:succinate dehydrogenase / fumarate reductase flavoprotein subunit
VARCIQREVREGRGSPHGGVFLDIAWIKERIPKGAEHIKKKLPSMYHQFMQLANIDITAVPMEVGPTTHYIMGGIRVDGDTQMSTVPGLFAAESAEGLHSANRLGRIRCPTCSSSASARASTRHSCRSNRRRVQAGPPSGGGDALAPSSVQSPEAPAIQHELQDMMQELVGIVRVEEEMQRALAGVAKLTARAKQVGVRGNREYNPGWHTALDLRHLLIVSEAITRAAIERKESRGGHFRDDYPDKDAAYATFNIVVRRGADGTMQLERRPIRQCPRCARSSRSRRASGRAGSSACSSAARDRRSFDQRNSTWPARPSRSGAANGDRVRLRTTRPRSPRGWWYSTPCTRSRRRRPATLRCDGTARPESAARARRRSTGGQSSCA